MRGNVRRLQSRPEEQPSSDYDSLKNHRRRIRSGLTHKKPSFPSSDQGHLRSHTHQARHSERHAMNDFDQKRIKNVRNQRHRWRAVPGDFDSIESLSCRQSSDRSFDDVYESREPEEINYHQRQIDIYERERSLDISSSGKVRQNCLSSEKKTRGLPARSILMTGNIQYADDDDWTVYENDLPGSISGNSKMKRKLAGMASKRNFHPLDNPTCREWRSWSSDSASNSETRSQRWLHDSHGGYLPGKHASLQSEGSSVHSFTRDRNGHYEHYGRYDHYINAELAAQSVVESLESKGYKYSHLNGIEMSGSESTKGVCERYSMVPSRDNSSTKSFQRNTPVSGGATIGSTKQVSLKKFANPPDNREEARLTISSESVNKVPRHSDSVSTKGSSRMKPKSTLSRATASQGSSEKSKGSVFRAKVKTSDGLLVGFKDLLISKSSSKSKQSSKSSKVAKVSKSLHIKTSLNKEPPSRKSSIEKSTLSKSKFDGSKNIQHSCQSDIPTSFDESTISTKSIFIKDQNRPAFAILSETATISLPSIAESSQSSDNKLDSIQSENHVGSSNESPPLTGSGERVPEMLLEQNFLSDGSTTLMSDLSSLPTSGQSTLTNMAFHGLTENKVERFLERCFLTCRLAVFQPE